MSYGQPLNLSLPSLADTMAEHTSKVATALSSIQTVLAQKVTPAGMNINAGLPFGGNPITGLGSLGLAAAAIPTAAGSIYYSGGSFYAIDATGTIQLTSGGTINIGALGSIVGDYGGANPARVTYDDASGEYRFTEDSGVWADLAADDVILYGANGNVRLGVDAAINTTRTFNFKSLPTGSDIGLLAYEASNNALIDAATATLTKAITSSAAITTTANVKGADVKYTSSQKLRIPAAAAQRLGTTAALVAGGYWNMLNELVGNYLIFPVELRGGDRVISWALWVDKGSTSGTLTAQLCKYTLSPGGAETALSSSSSSITGSIGAFKLQGLALTIDVSTSAAEAYYVKVTPSGVTGDLIYHLEVDIQRP